MIVFPNAKINIGLNIIEKRTDGLHNINSCFYPVPWYDALEVIEAEKFNFTTTGIDIPGEANICIHAYELIKRDFPLPPVNIHLHKNIPIGAGLGGGSADGAFMLKLLNDKFSLNLPIDQLQNYASQLGSDCPFFIENTPCYVEGTGNVFSPISMNLEGLFIAILYPKIHVETKLAYSKITPTEPGVTLKEILESNPVNNWPSLIANDFEKNADAGILQLKKMLYNQGAHYSSMTGSGSAVYGLFSKRPDLNTSHPNIIAEL